jgi:hypothetical protein
LQYNLIKIIEKNSKNISFPIQHQRSADIYQNESKPVDYVFKLIEKMLLVNDNVDKWNGSTPFLYMFVREENLDWYLI